MDWTVFNYKSKTLLRTFIAILLSQFLVSNILAASLDSPANVTDSSSAMFTIEDLFNLLNDGVLGTKRTTVFTEPTSGPSITAADHDLNEVMAIAPSIDDTNGAGVADVTNGKTFWGLKTGAWGLQTGTNTSAYPAIVPKTGQTTCYDITGTLVTCTGLKHDGDLQRGVAHAAPRFFDPDNGTFTDLSTGLIWLEDTNCAGVARGWADALSDIDSLNTTGAMNSNNCNDLSAGGASPTHQTDWRLPNVKELQSLIDFQNMNPALPAAHPFLNVQNNYYWSSTSHIGVPTQAWAVDMAFGNVRGETKNAAAWFVWPVRGGQ